MRASGGAGLGGGAGGRGGRGAAFLAGMASSSELIDAELNLAKVRTERLQAAYNYDLMLARLLEAAGVSDEFASYIRRPDARQVLFVREK